MHVTVDRDIWMTQTINGVTYTKARLAPLAADGINSRPGTAVGIAIENQWQSDETATPAALSHSQQTLTDALAVYAMLGKLDPTLSTAAFKHILNAEVNDALFGIDEAGISRRQREMLRSTGKNGQKRYVFDPFGLYLLVYITAGSAHPLGDVMTYNTPRENALLYELQNWFDLDTRSPAGAIGNKHLAFYGEGGFNVTALNRASRQQRAGRRLGSSHAMEQFREAA